MPNHSPVRPKPLITSSAMSRMPCSSQISRMRCQYASDGMCEPFGVEIGSAMKAAMVSARWNFTTSST